MEKSNYFNPTPISKLFITLFLGISLTSTVNDIYMVMIIVFIAVFFALNGKAITAINTLIFYFVLVLIVNRARVLNISFIDNYILTILIFIKIFFMPLLAGKFLVGTSDVSSMIASFEKMKFPKFIVIPLAIMFRYFPAFKEDKKNIKMAMKMRGISFINPIRYLEYVSVPILISAVGIADDISKSAETKCIADPCKKTRFTVVKFSIVDLVYVIPIIVFHILGRIYA